MENPINITALNDFIFCPISIFFHNLYSDTQRELYQCEDQINGTNAHKSIDNNEFSTDQKVIQGISVYCEKYSLIGKIDMFYPKSGKLVERKKKIKTIYDGYVFQLYGQYFAMKEMGYAVKSLSFHSMDDNKNYPVPLPEEDSEMLEKFEKTVKDINSFDIFDYEQTNHEKCSRCIYSPICHIDKGLVL